MHKSNHQAIRVLLQQFNDGLTIAEIAERTEIDRSSINRVLTQMADAYIDRWTENRKQWAAVWCVIVPPENCPKPERTKSARPTKLCSVEQPKLSKFLYGGLSENARATGSH